MTNARDYLDNICASLRANPHAQDFYKGKAGALRLGQAFGYGLTNLPEEQVKEIRGSLYGLLVVQWCILRGWDVPLDNREFLGSIDEGIAKAKGA